LAGRSGEGKSTIATAVLKLLRGVKANGQVCFQGRELLALSEREMRRYPGELNVALEQRVLIAMALLHRPGITPG
jgi:ABC-type dipeptide/oligopeptide/nickel transport system ATPase component